MGGLIVNLLEWWGAVNLVIVAAVILFAVGAVVAKRRHPTRRELERYRRDFPNMGL